MIVLSACLLGLSQPTWANRSNFVVVDTRLRSAAAAAADVIAAASPGAKRPENRQRLASSIRIQRIRLHVGGVLQQTVDDVDHGARFTVELPIPTTGH
ncbi:hypothetical protein [Rhodococcus sp. SMB37]|uniref:hypothetical protein n=1 Tax=Rhodococcus sp. SMB37 TaxID=2512213 RepID=UPI001F540358|nr:hypothetical protein [Rhodococcus sp. SMB37]